MMTAPVSFILRARTRIGHRTTLFWLTRLQMEASFNRPTQGSNNRRQASDMRRVYDPDSLLGEEVGDLYQFQIFSELRRTQDLGHNQC